MCQRCVMQDIDAVGLQDVPTMFELVGQTISLSAWLNTTELCAGQNKVCPTSLAQLLFGPRFGFGAGFNDEVGEQRDGLIER